MAYPFEQAPTIRAVVDRLVANYGCQLTSLGKQLVGPRGPTTIQYLVRQNNGATHLSEPLPEDLDDRLSPDTAARLIRQLKLPDDGLWIWAGTPATDDD